ncbi:MAG: hypothetical protein U5L11_10760 [Arhodomonas sp.]|nr:hypothetical protein [Arhodomonas sp.]
MKRSRSKASTGFSCMGVAVASCSDRALGNRPASRCTVEVVEAGLALGLIRIPPSCLMGLVDEDDVRIVHGIQESPLPAVH